MGMLNRLKIINFSIFLIVLNWLPTIYIQYTTIPSPLRNYCSIKTIGSYQYIKKSAEQKDWTFKGLFLLQDEAGLLQKNSAQTEPTSFEVPHPSASFPEFTTLLPKIETFIREELCNFAMSQFILLSVQQFHSYILLSNYWISVSTRGTLRAIYMLFCEL